MRSARMTVCSFARRLFILSDGNGNGFILD